MIPSHSKAYGEYQDIIAGVLAIYTLSGSRKGAYYARIKYPNQKYLRKSLRTSDRNEAIHRAQELYYETRGKQALNLPIGTYSFNTILDKFRTSRKKRKLKKHWSSYDAVCDNYLLPYFEFNTDITRLSEDDIAGYWPWRMDYWKHNDSTVRSRAADRLVSNFAIEPCASSLEQDLYALRSVLKYAQNEGYIKRLPHVELPVKRDRMTNSRASFSLEEWLAITELLQAEAKAPYPVDGTAGQRRAYTSVIRRARRLQTWIHTIANTGIRPQELKYLKFKDCRRWKSPYKSDHGRLYTIFEIGPDIAKTGRPRTVYAREKKFGTWERINWWREHHAKWKEDDDLIFSSERTRGRPVDIMPTMRRFLNRHNLRQTPKGDRSSYSFRSFYASQRIIEGTSLHALSLNMGTSLQMLEYHYLRHETTDVRENLQSHIQTELTKPDGRHD
jgi:hypothetical protein